MRCLVLNSGSATLKHRLYAGEGDGPGRALAGGTVEVSGDHGAAARRIIDSLPQRPQAVAHRVVHGGGRFHEPALIDERVEEEIGRLSALAPLHNPPALEGIRAARSLGVPMVAVFDTAFHRTLPERAYRYAIPEEAAPGVRRYGFHGISHRYAAERYAEIAGSAAPSIIVLHLGNGCSAAAIQGGRCIDTSMGFSPLEGLVMGTRAGDLDPGILIRWMREGRSADEIDRILQSESGLRALAGAADMRELLRRADAAARLAVEIFCYRARKYVGAYLAALGGAEAVVFTGGIGENSPEIRAGIAAGMEWAGLSIDADRNRRGGEGRISTDGSRLAAYVIECDEELLIAREALRCLRNRSCRS